MANNANAQTQEQSNTAETGEAATASTGSTTIWQELETWGRNFRPWQKFILSCAIRFGNLSDEQIDQANALFLRDNQLAGEPNPAIEVPETITGRPADASSVPVSIASIESLHSINALPFNARLPFSPGLTVIYGGNGVGKTGFTRVLSHACFSRMQHRILPNIYAENATDPEMSAQLIMKFGSDEISVFFVIGNTPYSELKRIAVFDSSVAVTHLTQQSPLGFKPTGFDVFPEMARIYSAIASRLNDEIARRNRENNFVRSFIGAESPVSRFVAGLNGNTNIEELRTLATFGENEAARLEEVQRQIAELQSRSVAATIAQLTEGRQDITAFQTQLNGVIQFFSDTNRAMYRQLLEDFAARSNEAIELRKVSFEGSTLNSTGTTQWEQFIIAARALAQVESANYPSTEDHCLLCQRQLDESTLNLIRRFWNFLESDLRQRMAQASSVLDGIAGQLRGINFEFFGATTGARRHINRLSPDLETQIIELLQTLQGDRATMLTVLESGAGEIPPANFPDLSGRINSLLQQINADIQRLQEQNVEAAIRELETERLTLRHRQVLHQLQPDVERFIHDLAWANSAADAPRRSLNPRHLTEKETELFSTVIAENYRQRLNQECEALGCNIPVQFRTKGDRGQTVKSLAMPGGYSPEEILSEGEQRAVALADFLTEVTLNPANAGIVLDDPVTSQDHERKEKIATRLVLESRNRQVIIFTHDLVFFNKLSNAASENDVQILTHWVVRDAQGNPGEVLLDDCPSTTSQYKNTQKAQNTLAEARASTGSEQEKLIRRGMGELRRTIEEMIPQFLFKGIVTRWSDRVMVTALRRVNWQDAFIEETIGVFEALSAYIDGHTHTEEMAGSPPAPAQLELMITRVNDLIRRVRADRQMA